VLAEFPALSLKARISHIVAVLTEHLPKEFFAAQQVLAAALPAPLDPSLSDDDFGEFIWVIPGEYVATYGCEAQHLETALAFLRESTKRFSAENAMRPFLQHFPDITLAFLTDCTTDPNYHVRRLASESTRPLLPWSPRVTLPSKPVFTILDSLHSDPTRYVTRSVANALNDYTKLDPSRVIKHLKRWQKLKQQNPKELTWLTKHALRTLVKEAHPHAMATLGLTTNPKFRLQHLTIDNEVTIGGTLQVQAQLLALASQTLDIGVRLYFRKKDGKHTSKRYKIKQAAFQKGDAITVNKRIPIKPMTTRTLYPGEQFVAIEVNGVERTKQAFTLS
jgi:3-methyladenine DNA glycosylase AlkC